MDQGEDVPTETGFEVFNTGIPDPNNDVLVDVADYTHVKNGPQTILVGHNAHYALDTTEGRFGFLYDRKHGLDGSLAAKIEEVVSAALSACKRLDEDERLSGKINFTGGSTQVVLKDRLGAVSGSADTLKGELKPILDRLYAGARYEIAASKNPKRPLTVDIRAEGKHSPAQLLENLSG